MTTYSGVKIFQNIKLYLSLMLLELGVVVVVIIISMVFSSIVVVVVVVVVVVTVFLSLSKTILVHQIVCKNDRIKLK